MRPKPRSRCGKDIINTDHISTVLTVSGETQSQAIVLNVKMLACQGLLGCQRAAGGGGGGGGRRGRLETAST